ncbi:aspartyl-phosphate phosphatase Spo0E family protein [Bacillus sp. EB01]|uniref:Spo0E family sporulation regulatory protein-aspartic acid phosphatase n=1 Tax=Bacillus sp. EB01 TaxID=1347086 RepID=UPI0005C45A8F
MKVNSILTPSELLKYIEFLRKEMIRTGFSSSLRSMQTIELSQELDFYIFQYQLMIKKPQLTTALTH